MTYQARLLKVLEYPHISEKANVKLEKCNTVVFKVARYATKLDVKNAVCMLFSVKVNSVNVLIVLGKRKGTAGRFGKRKNYKKAYVILESGSKIDLINKIE